MGCSEGMLVGKLDGEDIGPKDGFVDGSLDGIPVQTKHDTMKF